MKDRSCKDNYMWNPSTCDCDCKKSCKIDKYLDVKNYSYEKHLIGKLVITYEDQILNRGEASLDYKEVTCELEQ